ncbi:MAG: methyltransferase family protein [Candidatus Hodarchaeales archaeon]|jgi:protein-S-isoprenylcysteine O-methyltransferase Ste14
MLDRLIFICGVVGAWFFSGIFYFVSKKILKDWVPPGTLTSEIQDNDIEQNAPGSFWSRAGVSYTMTTNMLILIFIVLLNILDWWEGVSLVFVFDLHPIINGIGLVGLWFYYIWGTVTMLYNVNYTPLWKPIAKDYCLATGGPYSIVRHPMYAAKGIYLVFFIFLTTGTWLVILSVIGWIFFPYQVEAEEELLRKRFGKDYNTYVDCTGRFFPKILILR